MAKQGNYNRISSVFVFQINNTRRVLYEKQKSKIEKFILLKIFFDKGFSKSTAFLVVSIQASKKKTIQKRI